MFSIPRAAPMNAAVCLPVTNMHIQWMPRRNSSGPMEESQKLSQIEKEATLRSEEALASNPQPINKQSKTIKKKLDNKLPHVIFFDLSSSNLAWIMLLLWRYNLERRKLI